MSPVTVMFIMGLGVLLFGKNLPEVARKVGMSLMEFKRGMSELKGTFDIGGSLDTPCTGKKSRNEVHSEPTFDEPQESVGTKFEPPQEA